VAQGMTCPEVSRLLGDSPRSVEYWVHRFEARGLAGLQEGERSGRPSRLDQKQMAAINRFPTGLQPGVKSDRASVETDAATVPP
jgi:transposase